MTDQNSKLPGWPPADNSASQSGWPQPNVLGSASDPASQPQPNVLGSTAGSTPNATPDWGADQGGWQQGGWQQPAAPGQQGPWQPGGYPAAPGQQPSMDWTTGQAWAYGAPVQRKAGPSRVLMAFGALVVVAVAVAALAAFGAFGSKEVTATSSVKPDQGKEVFNDDFSDRQVGWWVGSTSYSSAAYDTRGYMISGTGDLVHFVPSPSNEWYRQMSVTITASQSADQPEEAGFGVYCVREDYGAQYSGSGGSRLAYEFLVMGDGSWSIDRRNGDPNESDAPTPVKSGRGAPAAGKTPITVQAVCATFDKQQTRLILFVNGTEVGEATDSVTTMPDELWEGGILVASVSSTPQAAVITSYVERDLSK